MQDEPENILDGRSREMARELRRINLNLLPILSELLRSQSVSKTAAGLNVTQSAVSQALRQLRDYLRDDLLVTTGREPHLTEKGQRIQRELGPLLAGLNQTLMQDIPFDPANEATHFVICTVDYAGALLAPHIWALIGSEAPKVTFEILSVDAPNYEALSAVDFLVAPSPLARENLGTNVAAELLWSEELVCLGASNNPLTAGPIALETFSSSPKARFRLPARSPYTDDAMIQPSAAHEENARCTFSNFSVLASVLESSQLVAIVPTLFADVAMRNSGLRAVPILDYTARHDIACIWSRTAEGRRGHAWFRGIITRAAAAIKQTGSPTPTP